jgi:hypothetical protein
MEAPMPENQSQANMSGSANPNGDPKLSPQPDRSFQEDRPSDTEAAHAPNEGAAVRDPRLQTPEAREAAADQNHGSLDGHPSKDLSGDAQTGERLGDRGNRLGS